MVAAVLDNLIGSAYTEVILEGMYGDCSPG